MIDFKILVKVDPSNPQAAVAVLGQKVLNNEKAFASVDPVWVSKQDYITALPVAVALTVEMRAVVQANSPETKFIVTGVTTENVATLKEDFDYKVYALTEKKDSPKKEEDENPKVQYWYNGQKVSEEEYQKHAQDFKQQVENLFGSMSKLFLN